MLSTSTWVRVGTVAIVALIFGVTSYVVVRTLTRPVQHESAVINPKHFAPNLDDPEQRQHVYEIMATTHESDSDGVRLIARAVREAREEALAALRDGGREAAIESLHESDDGLEFMRAIVDVAGRRVGEASQHD